MEKLLALGLLVIAAIVGVWDVSMAYSGHGSATVSAVLQSWSKAYPILPFAAGLIAGHVFWPYVPDKWPEERWTTVWDSPGNQLAEKAIALHHATENQYDGPPCPGKIGDSLRA